jgi:hypothetical protein
MTTARRIGYVGQKSTLTETVFVRELARGGYPRFHLYVSERDASNWVFNLHLDQKKPVYEGQTAHSGEYDGALVEGEAQRIWAIVKPA